MNRSDSKPHAHAHKSYGQGLFKGLLVGMVIGVILSAALAIYIERMPNPFVKRVDSAPTASEKPITDMPDVSKHGLINPTTVEGSQGTPGNAPISVTPQPVLPNPVVANPPTSSVNSTPVVAPGGAADTAALSKKENSPSPTLPNKITGASLYVQTGAFSQVREAEDQRANLALIGIDALILPPNSNNEKLYRVRIGPLATQDEVRTLIGTLNSNGFKKTTVVKEKGE